MTQQHPLWTDLSVHEQAVLSGGQEEPERETSLLRLLVVSAGLTLVGLGIFQIAFGDDGLFGGNGLFGGDGLF